MRRQCQRENSSDRESELAHESQRNAAGVDAYVVAILSARLLLGKVREPVRQPRVPVGLNAVCNYQCGGEVGLPQRHLTTLASQAVDGGQIAAIERRAYGERSGHRLFK